VRPGAGETSDAADDDCDGDVDEDAADAPAWYTDGDGDGDGDGPPVRACEAPVGTVATSTDCDDTRADVRPGAPETCDATDQDCDGAVDEDATDATAWYPDADGDGFGAGEAEVSCTGPAGYSERGDDCDDADADTHPGADELWYDGADRDCDGASDYDRDGDGVDADSFGGTDCDDTDAAVSPGAQETWYDGVDQDCDGVDDDQDRDGVPVAADCDDTDPAVAADCSAAPPVAEEEPTDEKPGCGCATPAAPPGLLAAGLVALLVRRRASR
jgi:MYXO-CTERM domain-containing protein